MDLILTFFLQILYPKSLFMISTIYIYIQTQNTSILLFKVEVTHYHQLGWTWPIRVFCLALIILINCSNIQKWDISLRSQMSCFLRKTKTNLNNKWLAALFAFWVGWNEQWLHPVGMGTPAAESQCSYPSIYLLYICNSIF